MRNRPAWYIQRPTDRIERIIERLSKGRVIRRDEAEDIAYRLAKRMCGVTGSVPKAVIGRSIAFINGKRIDNGYLIWDSRVYGTRINARGAAKYSRSIKIVKDEPNGTCFWCGKGLYSHAGHPPDRYHQHCNRRLCRELMAVWNKRHGSIRMNRKGRLELAEQKANFIARFFLLKQKQLLEN